MSKKTGNKFYIKKEEPEKCAYCGKVAELRPYGKNGANICFKCAMEDEEEAKKQFGKILDSVETVVVVEKKLNIN